MTVPQNMRHRHRFVEAAVAALSKVRRRSLESRELSRAAIKRSVVQQSQDQTSC